MSLLSRKLKTLVTPVLTTALSLVVGKRAIAGERDLPHRELFALLDLEDEIDARAVAGFELDRFRHDMHVEIAVLAVEIDDVHDVALHEGARQRAAVLRLQDLS